LHDQAAQETSGVRDVQEHIELREAGYEEETSKKEDKEMSWLLAVAEGIMFLALAVLLAVYTRRPVWVFGVFLVLTAWKFIRLVKRGGG